MASGMKKIKDTVSDRLKAMIEKGKSAEGFFAQVAYPEYRNAQRKRFLTENDSQGNKWSPLNAKYKEWKRVNYAGWVGDGQKTNIRSGRLITSLLGKSFGEGESVDGTKEHRLMIQDKFMLVGTTVPYAKHVDDVRPIMQFKKEFIDSLKTKYLHYVVSK